TAILEGHSGWVNSITFSPDGKLIASGSYDKTIRLWDVATGAPTAALEGHSNCTDSIAFSPDGKLLASASDDGTIRLWDVATKVYKIIFRTSSEIQRVSFSQDGKFIEFKSD